MFVTATVSGCVSASKAHALSKEEYRTSLSVIAADQRLAAVACDALRTGSNLCRVEASGRESVDRASLASSFSPSPANLYRLRVAQADSRFAVARETCDGRAGAAQGACIEDARTAQRAAKALANRESAATSEQARAESRARGAAARAKGLPY